MQERVKLNRGVFTLSLDFELIWGTVDLFGPDRFRRACEIERAEVIDRLLDLLVEFEIPATWFVVGHLMLDRCNAEAGLKHREIIRPTHSWQNGDWFAHDPCGAEPDAPLFFARSLIEKIRACAVRQEIGCHSFSHVIFGDEGCSRETAESEIAACVRVAKEMGIELRSFAFPRNQVGHLDVLREYGFTCYRGPEPQRAFRDRLPNKAKRLAHLADVITTARPPAVLPEKTESGLWNVPGSMVYFPAHGLRRFIPMSLRVKRAIKGLDRAARDRRIFHLWFHPTNLAEQTENMFSGLRAILEYASSLRARDELTAMPVGAFAERCPAQVAENAARFDYLASVVE